MWCTFLSGSTKNTIKKETWAASIYETISKTHYLHNVLRVLSIKIKLIYKSGPRKRCGFTQLWRVVYGRGSYIVGSRGASQLGGSLLGIPPGYKANKLHFLWEDNFGLNCKRNITFEISYKIVALFTENYPSTKQPLYHLSYHPSSLKRWSVR